MSSYGEVNSNIDKVNGTVVSQGNGTANNGCQRITVASDNTAFPTVVSGTAKGGTSAASATVSAVDADHNALDVYVRGGGGSGSTVIAPGTIATYMSSDPLFTPAANATDIWTMTGSSTKTVKILRLCITYTGTNSGSGIFFLLRRSSANSGGTSATTTAAKMDTNDGASTCSINSYTANPSALGSTAAQLACLSLTPIGSINYFYTSGFGDIQIFNYDMTGQPLILRGTSDILAINCNGTTPTGGTVKLSVRVIFTEE